MSSSMLSEFQKSATSPFDAIKQSDEQGEFWSARDLMASMQYTEWRNFKNAILKAEASAENKGSDHIVAFNKMILTGKNAKRQVEDYRLTRFGAYLVVMNGDPRQNSLIADAQTYFAVQTRKAETQLPAQAPDYSNPSSVVALAEQALQTARAYEQSEKRRLELEGPAAERELYRASKGLQLIGDVANRFRSYAQDRYPEVKVTQNLIFDHAGRLGIIIRGNTVRHNQPTSRAIQNNWTKHHESLVETDNHGTKRNVTTRLTVKGESRLWDGLITYIETNGTLELKKEDKAA